jgi:hypothetical protein
MATLPSSTVQREHNKFDLNSDSEVAVRVIADGVDVTATPAGLRNSFLVTTLDVTSTAIALPTSPLTDRNAMTIRNLSATDSLYIGPANTVTATETVGTLSGRKILPGEDFNIDVKDTVVIYGIAESGKTVRVQVFEVS